MDIRLIVFGMVVILAGLFLGAKFFVPKEKNKSRLEGQFVEAVSAFIKEPNESNYQACLERAKALPHLKNREESVVKDFLARNKVVL